MEEGFSNDDLKKLLYKVQDAGSAIEKELNSHGMKGVIPQNAKISYEGHEGKDDDVFSSVPDPQQEHIHLRPTSIPESEQLRMLQEMEEKEMYALGRMYTKLGDKLIKMNYMSDDPKVNEKLIAIQLQEMLIFAFTSLQVFNEFMNYFEKFKSK